MSEPVFLTLDLGTSATKAALWSPDGLVALGRAAVRTDHTEPGRAEQDPAEWWASVACACADAREAAPVAWSGVAALGFSAARETFVPVAADGAPLGPGLLWSDRRAEAEAEELGEAVGGAEVFRSRTGLVVHAGSMVAKVAWLARHEPERLERARWLLAPRDWIAWRLTGEVTTDITLASRTGFVTLGGENLPETVAVAGERLPPVREPATVLGSCETESARDLGLPPGVPVVLGAGDRACELIGSGAGERRPMVSWGTTANVSVPADRIPAEMPRGVGVSRGALGGFLLEAGLSAAGAALEWLSGVTGLDPRALAEAAADAEPGARGLIAVPWLSGARAPWWRPEARAAFLGLSLAHGPKDLARAIVEGVAMDVARCLEALAMEPERLEVVGGGAAFTLWRRVLAAATRLPVERRRSDEAASAGACLIAAAAVAADFELDRINPAEGSEDPEPDLVVAYSELRPASDAATHAILGLGLESSGS